MHAPDVKKKEKLQEKFDKSCKEKICSPSIRQREKIDDKTLMQMRLDIMAQYSP